MIYGIIPLTTSKYGFLNIAHAVKILTPNGGVTVPNVACIVIKIPIATGSIPVDTAIGKNIGVKIAMATNESTNIQERSEEHTSELQSRFDLVCRLLLEKKKNTT